MSTRRRPPGRVGQGEVADSELGGFTVADIDRLKRAVKAIAAASGAALPPQ
ncbi:MAG: hypothetical protein ACJ73E_06740 [Mycobacteriales bacterium]